MLTSAIVGGLLGLLLASPMASGRISEEPLATGVKHALIVVQRMAMMIAAPGLLVGSGVVGFLVNALLWASTVIVLRSGGSGPRMRTAKAATAAVWGASAVMTVAAVLIMDGD